MIEEFVAFMGAYDIESMFKAFDDFDDWVYRPDNFAIRRYCYVNMNTITILMHLLRKSLLSKRD